MPWGAMSTKALREEFVRLSAFEGSTIRELCRRFGISPKTGYKWLSRARAGGEAWAADRSRRPCASPLRCPPAIEAAVLAVRAAHPAWGGRKIAAVLAREGLAAPAPSTVTAILRRHGMAVGTAGGGVPFRRFEQAAANDLWQMDFKGHVGLGDGTRLHPLSVLDDHSRYALVLAACPDERTGTVREALIGAFRRYGLPRAVITDNGPPWGDGPGHPFTPLGVFLIEQGIRIAHARPYHPQTLGKDERFHRSLKAEVLSGPPFASLAAAARALERWRHVYNRKRPHEGIGLAVPADRYTVSPRLLRDPRPLRVCGRRSPPPRRRGRPHQPRRPHAPASESLPGQNHRPAPDRNRWPFRGRLPPSVHRRPRPKGKHTRCSTRYPFPRTPVTHVPGLNTGEGYRI